MLRLLAVSALAVLLALCAGAGVVLWRLPSIAEWVVERSAPGVRAKVGSLGFEGLGKLRARDVELRKRGGPPLLAVREVIVGFDPAGLLGRRLAILEIVEPDLQITPGAAGLFPSGGRPAGGGGWTIERAVCRYGTVRVEGLGKPDLAVKGTFAFEIAPGRFELAAWGVEASRHDAAPFASLDLIEASGDPVLPGGRVERVSVKGGLFTLGAELLGLLGEGAGEPLGLVLGRIDVDGLAIRIEESLGLPRPLDFTLNTSLTNVPLDRLATAVGDERQFVEIADLEVLSPLDPLAKVIELRAVGVGFTLAGIARQEIEDVTITTPTIHLGEDLFWYMESGGSGGPLPAWTIRRLTIVDGRLVVGGGGRRSYGIPLTFRTSASDVNLSNLAALRADLSLEIPGRTYAFEPYQLEFTSLPGELRFSYPPESGARNLVGTVHLSDLRWRQYRGNDAWLTVTFDTSGVNGRFGGNAYRGYLGGGFTFFFDPDAPWVGWVSGTRCDLKQITAVASPGQLAMSGRADFQLQVDARRTEIRRMLGSLKTRGGGTLEVLKLDDLLARVPPEWPAVKQSASRIAIQTLRDFDFETCGADFWFLDGQGRLDMRLRGPSGSRTFEVVLHADDSVDGRWKRRSGP